MCIRDRNEAARRGGKLVDAPDAREVAAIDGVRRRNAGVLAHEHRGDADALRAQGADLGGGVVDAGLPVVIAAERNFATRENFVAVVRAGVGEQDQQVLVSGSRFHQLAHCLLYTSLLEITVRGKLLHCQPLIVCFLKTVMIVFYTEVIFICPKIYFQMKWNSKVFI